MTEHVTSEALRSGEYIELDRYFFSRSTVWLALRSKATGAFLLCQARFCHDEDDRIDVIRSWYVSPAKYMAFNAFFQKSFDAYEGQK